MPASTCTQTATNSPPTESALSQTVGIHSGRSIAPWDDIDTSPTVGLASDRTPHRGRAATVSLLPHSPLGASEAALRLSPNTLAAVAEQAGLAAGPPGGLSAVAAIKFFKRSLLPSGTLNAIWKSSGLPSASTSNAMVSEAHFHAILQRVFEASNGVAFWEPGTADEAAAAGRRLREEAAHQQRQHRQPEQQQREKPARGGHEVAVAPLVVGEQRRVTVYRAGASESGAVLIVLTSDMTWKAFVAKASAKLGLPELLDGTTHRATVIVTTEEGAVVDELEALRDGDRVAVAQTTRGDNDSQRKSSQKTDLTEIQIGAQIGKGSFGTVYRGKWRGTDVAIKKLSTEDGVAHGIQDFRGEIATHAKLRHPNIVLFLGAVTEPPELCLVTEYVERGNLFDLLHEDDGRSNGTVLRNETIIAMALDVCRGMAYLHGFRPPLLHRDLKSSNLLVGLEGSIKICDFGLSAVSHDSGSKEAGGGTTGNVCGTAQWMAPEILQRGFFTAAADVYSFGVVLGEMISGEVPWHGLDAAAVAVRVCLQGLRPHLPPSTPTAMADLTSRCVHEEPDSRPTFRQLLELTNGLGDRDHCDAGKDNDDIEFADRRRSTGNQAW